MINHLRTLLLNQDSSAKPGPSYPGEEYVPDGFVHLSLPVQLSTIRDILFSPAPDRAMLNYRLRQYLPLLHTTELAQYVTDLDPRITYWPLYDNSLFNESSFGGTITLIAGSVTWEVALTNNPSQVTATNRLLNSWTVVIQDTSHIKLTHLQPPNEVITTTYSLTSGVSNIINLPGSSLGIQFTPGLYTSLPTWQITSLARPLLEIGDIYSALNQNPHLDVNSLFTGNTEPYLTCGRLWSISSGPIAYKMGAVILCLGYRMNEIFNNTYVNING